MRLSCKKGVFALSYRRITKKNDHRAGERGGSRACDGRNGGTGVRELAARQLLVIGLANDEIGYIVPPSDFLVNPEKPYFEKITDDKGENHYEETNSIGPACADAIADTWELLLNG